jgi:lysophospholipase L1-like esterase
MIRTAAAVALSPLLLAQALWVRARTPRLPEPPGARQGCAGHGVPLSLLILGDSAAAGVGAAHQNEALSGALVRALAPDFALEWELRAATGFGVEAVGSLIDDGARGFDVALLSVGVNDVTSVQRLTCWIDSMRALIARLIERHGTRLVLLTALPPMQHFPALPEPLRAVLAQRARRFTAALAELARTEVYCELLDAEFERRFDPRHMARDGFHPGPAAYALWAEAAAARIHAHFRSAASAPHAEVARA